MGCRCVQETFQKDLTGGYRQKRSGEGRRGEQRRREERRGRTEEKRKREERRCDIHLLVHFPNDCIDWGWARLNPEAMSFFLVFHVSGRNPGT